MSSTLGLFGSSGCVGVGKKVGSEILICPLIKLVTLLPAVPIAERRLSSLVGAPGSRSRGCSRRACRCRDKSSRR